jgi:heavy metal sensor kinase
MQRRSIRFRLTVWYAAVLCGALALFGVLLWFSMHARLIREVDENLDGGADRFQSYFRTELAENQSEGQLRDELNEFCQALPASSYVLVRGSSGFVFHYPADKPRPGPGFRFVRTTFSAAGDNFDLEVGTPMAEVSHTLDLLRLLLLSLLPVVIAASSVGGWWLSGRALRPVKSLTAAAHSISVENLSGRLPVPETGDELAQLTLVLNGMLARLEEAVKTLSQFAADASHELRTPLAVIRTTAELALRRERTAPEYRESLREVTAEAERMTALVEDLLTLARASTGPAEMPLAPVELDGVIQEVCAEMRPLADLRGIRLRVALENGAVIAGNRPALHRVFLVLLDNAVKYSREGGEVVVESHAAGNGVQVTVEDFGEGISAADLPHIFKRFYRADRSRSSAGHGIGLALAESIARAHGASIDVQSQPGAGSKFRVTFPVRTAGASENLQVTQV